MGDLEKSQKNYDEAKDIEILLKGGNINIGGKKFINFRPDCDIFKTNLKWLIPTIMIFKE